MPKGNLKTKTKEKAYAWAFNLVKKEWTSGPLKGKSVESLEDARIQIDNFMRLNHG